MREIFADTAQAIDNTQIIADMCNFDFEFGHTKLPYYETPNNMDHFEYFKMLCMNGMKKDTAKIRLKNIMTALNMNLKQ